MNNPPLISVVLGSYNRHKLLKLCIESIRQELERFPHEIIVVDGGSTDGACRWLLKQRDIITIIQHNSGKWKGVDIHKRTWGSFMNLGFKAAKGKYVCLVSDDCLIIPGAILNAYKYFEALLVQGVKLGALAFYWRNWPDDRKYMTGLTLGNKLFVNHGLFLKKSLEEVGYIDEDTFQFYHADGDLSLRIWNKGYLCLDSPDSYIEHFSHSNYPQKTNAGKNDKDDWDKYLKKWENIFYDKAKDDFGSWIEKEFTDTTFTAGKFKPFYMQNAVKKKVRYIINKVLGILK